MLNNPFERRRELVKKEGSAAQAEGDNHVKEIKALLFHPREFPVRRVDRDIPEGGFDVQL